MKDAQEYLINSSSKLKDCEMRITPSDVIYVLLTGTARDCRVMAENIQKHGIVPPDGYVVMPSKLTSVMRDAYESEKPPYSFFRTPIYTGDIEERYAAMVYASFFSPALPEEVPDYSAQ
jgi:hypothetical protein